MLYGPHGAPDFFTDDDIDDASSPPTGEVHYNSSRTGVRLIGPKPHWARADGGEAGLHPSNIHDNAYAIGTVDFTGDMPIILGPDGPSLGGFVCPATIVAGRAVEDGPARARRHACASCRSRTTQAHARCGAGRAIATLTRRSAPRAAPARRDDAPILRELPAAADARRSSTAGRAIATCWSNTGRMVLDLDLRFRVHALMQWLASAARCPASSISRPASARCRSTTTARVLPRERAARRARATPRRELPGARRHRGARRASCTCRCPGTTRRRSWPSTSTCSRCAPTRPGARATSSSSAASTASTRSTTCSASSSTPATWCSASATSTSARRSRRRSIRGTAWSPPSTTRRAPGRRRTPSASAAPTCASTAWKGPGGYQFVGRTLQMWNRFRDTADVRARHARGCCASSIRSASTRSSAEELLEMRARLPARAARRCASRTATFRLADYRAFLADERRRASPRSRPAPAGRVRGRARALGGRGRVRRRGHEPATGAAAPRRSTVPEGRRRLVEAPLTGSVWKHRGGAGPARGSRATSMVVLEAMKMEIAVAAPERRDVSRCSLRAGQPGRSPGQRLVIAVGGTTMSDRSLDRRRCRRSSGTARLADGGRRRRSSASPHRRRAGPVWISPLPRDDGAGARPRRSSAIAARRPPAARRRALRGQGQHRRRRPADHRRLSGLRLRARTHRATVVQRAGGRRRDPGRQDQPRPVRHRPGRHPLARTARVPASSTRATSPAARAPARRWRWPRAWSTSRSAPTPPARAACRPRSTASSGSSRRAGCSSTRGVVPACRSLDCVSIFARVGRRGARPATSPPADDRRIAARQPVAALPPVAAHRQIAVDGPGARSMARRPRPRSTRAWPTPASSASDVVEIDFDAASRGGRPALRRRVRGRALRRRRRASSTPTPTTSTRPWRSIIQAGGRFPPDRPRSPTRTGSTRAAGAGAARSSRRSTPCSCRPRPRLPTLAEVAADPVGVNSRLGASPTPQPARPLRGRGARRHDADGPPVRRLAVRAGRRRCRSWPSADVARLAGERERDGAPAIGPRRSADGTEEHPPRRRRRPPVRPTAQPPADRPRRPARRPHHDRRRLPPLRPRHRPAQARPRARRRRPSRRRRIEVEVWALPAAGFARFVAAVPAPLAIGAVELADGTWVPGFTCMPHALDGADDITARGGWRAYLAADPSTPNR